jgi:hypothetical protein
MHIFQFGAASGGHGVDRVGVQIGGSASVLADQSSVNDLLEAAVGPLTD